MTLRTRLTLFFTGIVVVPLLAATVGLQTLVNREIERRANTKLEVASDAVGGLWQERLDTAEREVRRAALELAGELTSQDLYETLEKLRTFAELDFLVVTDQNGDLLAASVGPSDYLKRFDAPAARDIAAEEGSPAILRARTEMSFRAARGAVTGGWFADASFLRDLGTAVGADMALVADGDAVASTITPLPNLPTAMGEPGFADDDLRALSTRIRGHDGSLVLLVPDERGGFLTSPVPLVVVLGLALATLVGYMLAGVLSRPLDRLTEAAKAVAAGKFDTTIEASDHGDMGRLAQAFNVMTENLRQHVGELRHSRDELRRSLDRLGTTLRSTHDLDAILSVVLETATATLGARSGVIYLLDQAGRELRLEVAHGLEPSPLTVLEVGNGIAGRAASGRAVLVPSRMEESPDPAAVEPVAETAMAVPLVRESRVMGVLALYGRPGPGPFAEEDVATLASFAGQASVAIENVLLHEEAQRMSITDGLTGIWNRRYLQFVLGKEIERAHRFSRPLSVLMLDIDRFKRVNDHHGHLAGDRVLVEVSRRALDSIRAQVDMLARYGGEEFVAVLPETAMDGARVVAEKIRAAIGEAPVAGPGETPSIPVTVSVGVAEFPADGAATEELLRAADLALYRAKQKGRNRVETSGSLEDPASTPTQRRTTL